MSEKKEVGPALKDTDPTRREIADDIIAYAEKRFRIYGADETSLDGGDIPYLIEGILAKFQPAVIQGPPKTLKTSLAIELCLSLASGMPFLGRFPVKERTPTLLLSGESGLPTIDETTERIAVSKGIDLAGLRGWFHKSENLPNLKNPLDIAAIGYLVEKLGIGVLVLDPLYLAAGLAEGREASLYAMGPALKSIGDACSKHGATFVFCHHTTKAGARYLSKAPSLSDTAYSGVEEFARQWILLKRFSHYVEDSGQHRLWLCAGGSAGHGGRYKVEINEGRPSDEGGRHWSPEFLDDTQTACGKAKPAKHSRKEKLREAYEKFPNGETQRALSNAAGLNTNDFHEAQAELERDGFRVELVRLHKGKTSYDGFKLLSA
jgi:hypothetical protein